MGELRYFDTPTTYSIQLSLHPYYREGILLSCPCTGEGRGLVLDWVRGREVGEAIISWRVLASVLVVCGKCDSVGSMCNYVECAECI